VEDTPVLPKKRSAVQRLKHSSMSCRNLLRRGSRSARV